MENELEKLKESMARLKQKQSRILKDKAASPLEIMKKNTACLDEMDEIASRIVELEGKV